MALSMKDVLFFKRYQRLLKSDELIDCFQTLPSACLNKLKTAMKKKIIARKKQQTVIINNELKELEKV